MDYNMRRTTFCLIFLFTLYPYLKDETQKWKHMVWWIYKYIKMILLISQKWIIKIHGFYSNRSSHRRCAGRKGVLRNFAKFIGKQVCQSASVLANELLHVYMLSKMATFIQAKLSFSYFRQVNLRKSS